MNFHLLLACTSLMCLSWNYPLLANISTRKIDRGLVKLAEYNGELINSITDHEYLIKHPYQKNNNYRNYSNKTKTYRGFITGQIPSIPLGTLEPEPTTPLRLPETLPTPDTSIPLVSPERSPTPFPLKPTIIPKIKVNRIEVNKSSVFSKEELDKAVHSFIGQELS